ncbi:MAG: hypothetical protein WCH04_10720 [Gammaproteobacteria bacterium]
MRPDERVWRRLESIGDPGAYLQVARNTALRPWVVGLHADHGAHDIELALRQQYRSTIDEVAHWMPAGWRGTVSWVRRLPDLPALQYLLTGAATPDWMRDDPELRTFASNTPAGRVQALQSSDCAALLKGWQRGEPLYASWLEHWRALWPEASRLVVGLEALTRLLRRHLGALSLQSGAASVSLYETLLRELNIAFRRYSFQPAAAFAHLGLVALDVQKLRAQLLQRALFAGMTESTL